MLARRDFKDVSMRDKAKVFESVIDIYDIAEEVAILVEGVENPVAKNYYISAMDSLIGELDVSLRVIVDEYNKIAKSGKVTKGSSDKISRAIINIQDAVSGAKSNIFRM